jgi:hypothetical protein
MPLTDFVLDARLGPLARALRDATLTTADRLDSREVDTLLGPLGRQALVQCFAGVGADEGTLWLVNQERTELIPAYSTSERAEQWVTLHRQPLDRGIVSMIFATEQTFSESELQSHPDHDATLDRRLGVMTTAMIGTPFVFGERVRGVMTCVRLVDKDELQRGDPSRRRPFGSDAAAVVELTSTLLGRHIDLTLIELALRRSDD